MSQIAQQDHLYIKVDSLEEHIFTNEQEAKLVECYKAGTLLDVVLFDGSNTSKIVYFSAVKDGTTGELTSLLFTYFFEDTPSVLTIEL